MENKHTSYDLAQMQSLPLEAKIIMTKQRIRAWYEHWDGNVYVSVSGGKDSQVLAHIVKSIYPDVPSVFVNTGLEYDSVRLKGQELADVVLKPEMDFVSVIKKYGYPIIGKEISRFVSGAKRWMENNYKNQKFCETNFNNEDYSKMTVDAKIMLGKLEYKEKGIIIQGEYSKLYDKSKYMFLVDAPFRISNKCCNIMKKKPMHQYCKNNQRKPITGQMASESSLRYKQWLKNGCNGFDLAEPISNPLSFWKEQDILQYIKKNNLQIADIYGEVVYQDDDGMFYDEPLFNESMNLVTTGAKRTGCVFCLFGITQDKERLLKLKEAEPKKYDYVMRGGKFDEQGMWIPDKGLGYKFVIDWLNEHGNLGIKY